MTNLARNILWDLLELVLAHRAVEHAQASQAPSLHPFPQFALQHFTLLRAAGASPRWCLGVSEPLGAVTDLEK